ncbi:PepSY domain-containing protein [Paracoccus albicereus]
MGGTAILSLSLLTTAAGAQIAPGSAAPSLGAAVEALEGKGYTILNIDRDDDGLEIDALTQAGARVEMLVDPSTTEILREVSDD